MNWEEDVLWPVCPHCHWTLEGFERADEVKKLRALVLRLNRLVVAHHSVGAMEHVLVGDQCPVCKEFTDGLK